MTFECVLVFAQWLFCNNGMPLSFFFNSSFLNINKSIKYVDRYHARVSTSESSILFLEAYANNYSGKKNRLPSHSIRKGVAQLLGWRDHLWGQRSDNDGIFFSCPSFLSLGPWFSCQAYKHFVLSFILY